MRTGILLATLIVTGAVLGLRAQTEGVALTGQITSHEEGAMEGVLVSAKKEGSSITVTVVSDEHGRYRFPKLELGNYSLKIRASGYDLSEPKNVAKPETVDLKLTKTADLASQLSNTEWLASFPGS